MKSFGQICLRTIEKYMCATVRAPVRKKPKKDGSRRNATLKYTLTYISQVIPGCKVMYLNTICLREWSVRSWTLKSDHNMSLSTVKELLQRPKRKDLFEEDRTFFRDFLSKLNKLPSHYCWKNTNRLYLKQIFQSYSDLFNAYKVKCNKNSKTPMSKNGSGNEHFYFPSKKGSVRHVLYAQKLKRAI